MAISERTYSIKNNPSQVTGYLRQFQCISNLWGSIMSENTMTIDRDAYERAMKLVR